MATELLELGPKAANATILFTYGAGAPVDSPAMTAVAEALAKQDLRVVRFEFSYVASRRTDGTRKLAPRADKVNSEYLAAIDALECGPLIIGGKSKGKRVASMIADVGATLNHPHMPC